MGTISRILGIAFLVCCGGAVVAAQDALTLRQAINQALGASPAAAGARASRQEAVAGSSLARTALLPQLGFTEDMSRGNDPVYVFGSRLRQGRFTEADFAVNALNNPEPIGNFATRLSGSWMAFDSFKTQKEIHRADLFVASASSASEASNQQITFKVVSAYQSVLYAQREIDMTEHAQETAAALLDSANEHVKAGLAVESDRMSAQVNLSERKQELIVARGDLELAWSQLREAIGVEDLGVAMLKSMEPRTYPQANLDKEVATAARMRPDLRAQAQGQSAQASAVGAAKSNFGPRVSAYGNWEEDRGSIGSSGGNNWVAGVQISLDILPLTKRAELARESAVKRSVDAQVAAYRQRVRLEVTQAHIHHTTAAQSLETAQSAVDQAKEGLRILQNRYSAGLATMTDLLRAEDAERRSQTDYWHAVYGNSMAYAELLYATGTLTPDAAEELQ